jgi:hypothetical protein
MNSVTFEKPKPKEYNRLLEWKDEAQLRSTPASMATDIAFGTQPTIPKRSDLPA